jgi:hypothetical protein
MEILEARLMTHAEIKEWESFTFGRNLKKKNDSAKYCAHNIKELIKQHREYKDIEIRAKYDKHIEYVNSVNYKSTNNNNIYKSIIAGNEVKCQCGGTMVHKVGAGYDFISCNKWTNKTIPHDTYNLWPFRELDSFDVFKSNYQFGKNYLNDFRKHCNISSVMPSVLFEYLFVINNETPLCPELDAAHYQVGVASRNQANKEEMMVKHIIKTKFPKVSDQLFIRYNTNFLKFQIAIIDIVASNPNEVVIFEIKKNETLADVTKLDLYQSLMRKIMDTIKDKRILTSHHIFYSFISAEAIKPLRGLTLKQLTDEF